MEPYYQNQHARQHVGLEGPNLAGKRRREIMASARNITIDSIQQFDPTQFHVASRSRLGAYYTIDLHCATCDCKDYLRIKFCKHIGAIYVHFPHLSVEDNHSTVSQEAAEAPDKPPCVFRQEESLQLLTQDISNMSHRLNSEQIDQSSMSLAVLEAIQLAKYSLAAAIASTQGTSAIPDKEVIAPNQKSWMETAERMGVKRAPKRKRLPEERGLTERSIGVTKGKRIRVYSDPYTGGERSGKCAKPDALSAVANARARASVHSSAGVVSPASQPLPATAPVFTFTSASQPLPTMAPTFAFTPASQPIPATTNTHSHTHAPLSSFVHGPPTQPISPRQVPHMPRAT
jgi:hypothetical protein